jgi:hypothetical protein
MQPHPSLQLPDPTLLNQASLHPTVARRTKLARHWELSATPS